jgi:diaminopimelate decarboxylase
MRDAALCVQPHRIIENYRRIDSALAGQPHRICYALKANANPELLRRLASLGAGADVVSGGELRQALQAGFPPDKIAFAGVARPTMKSVWRCSTRSWR